MGYIDLFVIKIYIYIYSSFEEFLFIEVFGQASLYPIILTLKCYKYMLMSKKV